ncbi:hypothetical protein [Pseudoalteromonas galatheae]|uniref:hypothetical protein n=1 Tax=Pseudoalteromonas galatheae TaxID=579562 RepID=UPI0030D0910C
MTYFRDLELIPDQSKSDLHYHADFIEIISLSCGEDGLNFDSLYDRYTEEQVSDYIEVIKERETSYADKYPFVLSGHTRLARRENISRIHLIYLFLLFCSHTNKTTISPSSLRSQFEDLSKVALSKYLPDLAICHTIGKSSNENDHYVGTIVNKLNKLAEDLKCIKTFEENDFSAQNSGDLGLDVVAWVPFDGDPHFHKIMQTYLCQCATGKDWVKKQSEPEKIKNVLRIPRASVDTLFVPYDLRSSDGTFHKFHEITIKLLFDRRRIINLFTGIEEDLAALGNLTENLQGAASFEPSLVD